MKTKIILEICNLQDGYGNEPICRNVNLKLHEGEILGIAGASGSGKSTLLKSIIDPLDYGIDIYDGKINYCDEEITHLSKSERSHLLGPEMGMIFQNPMASFNPLRKYRRQFEESLKSHGLWRDKSSIEEILEVFHTLALPRGEAILESCPYEMSGGMNQRIATALAILLKPKIILADEPTSALDVTSQQQVLALFKKIRDSYDLSMIIVSHDLCLLAQICDRVAVMEHGIIVEENTTEELVLNPKHEYTKALFSAVPVFKEVES